MRSSDWSSDVCSSDLPVRQHGGWSDGAAGPSVEARSDFRNRQRKELTTCVAWVCLQVLASFASAGVPRWGATSKAISFAVRPRSEEHTSELQSLMRISYAVFCLKKKNKIYNI